ncbi:NAD(P)/FAD-dependent oxidoreductase [Thermodesulfobacteriota bacterium]
MNIGIIGGGMMGLATAFYLNKKGHQVTILEKEHEIGGLSRSTEILSGVNWDRFYHVILSTDTELLDFINEMGLSLDVQFRETKTGFYAGGGLHSMSTTMEFLKFKPLSLLDKFRLGAGIFYTSKLKNWKRLEKLYVKTWLIRVFGRSNFEKMWEPLLRSKLGTASDRVSAAFIWATIRRYYGTRQSSSKKEMMGCVRGGYYSILNQIRRHLTESGTRITTNYNAQRIESIDGGKISIQSQNGSHILFDRVIATTPNPVIKRLLPNLDNNFASQLEAVQYLGVICVLLVLKRSLVPFYITNLTDSDLPFTGLIEATNVMPEDILDGRTLVYLPKYIPQGDSFYEKSDAEIIAIFLKGLKCMFPDFNENEIISNLVHREPYVQQIHEIGYSEKIPPMKTPLKNFYIANTAMIVNSPLNNNEVIKIARKAADMVANDYYLQTSR